MRPASTVPTIASFAGTAASRPVSDMAGDGGISDADSSPQVSWASPKGSMADSGPTNDAGPADSIQGENDAGPGKPLPASMIPTEPYAMANELWKEINAARSQFSKYRQAQLWGRPKDGTKVTDADTGLIYCSPTQGSAVDGMDKLMLFYLLAGSQKEHDVPPGSVAA